MTELSHTARKLLARKKMRDLLLSAATQSENQAIEREQAFLGNVLQNVREGKTQDAEKVLAEKIAELESRKPSNQAEDSTEPNDDSMSKMTLDDESKLQTSLRQVAKGQRTPGKICDPEYWRQFASGLSITTTAPGENHCKVGVAEDVHERLADSLREQGYFVTRPQQYCAPKVAADASSCAIDMDVIDAAMEELKAAGWPPVFIYMFDEVWHIIQHLWTIMQPFLGEDCVLEPSFFAWAVGPLAPGTGGVGGNFGLPHRDYPFGESCHSDSEHSPKLLSVWLPVTDATLKNGCMYVLPKKADALFDQPKHPAHMRSAGEVKAGVVKMQFPLHAARPLPAPKGSILCWNGCLVHWGASCAADAPIPRKSIAMTFRAASVAQLEGDGEPISRTKATVANMSMGDRLQLIARALLLYSQWYTLKDSAVPEIFFE